MFMFKYLSSVYSLIKSTKRAPDIYVYKNYSFYSDNWTDLIFLSKYVNESAFMLNLVNWKIQLEASLSITTAIRLLFSILNCFRFVYY